MFTRLSSVIEDSRLRPRLLSIVFYRNQQHLKDLSGEDGCWFQQTPLTRTRDEDLAQVIELKEIIKKKSREQREMKGRLAALSARVTELEKDLDTARKDLLKSKEVKVKLQQDIREAMAQKEDMEKRITTLEKRYLAAQRKAISVHNLHDKLENEIANKDSMHRQTEDKDRQLQECLELAEQKLQQMLTEVVAELAQPVAALSKDSGSLAPVQAAQCPGALLLGTAEQRHHPGVGALGVPLARSVACFALLSLLLANFTLTSLPQLPAIQEEVEDDTIKCETSSSTSLRSFHLDRLTGSLRIASDEDIRDAHNTTGSQDGPGGNPSNSNSSQDSLQKAPKKKGITSSIGRWFGRKEKGRPGHASKEALGPDHYRLFHGPCNPELSPEMSQAPGSLLPAPARDQSLFRGHWAQAACGRTCDEDLAQVIELKEIIKKKSREQREMKDRLAALSAHVTELEKDLDTARKDLLKSKEVKVKLQQDIHEDNIGYLVSMEGPEMDFEPADRTRIGSKLCSWFERFLHGV
ncbi:hypothetical protein MJT46_012344 [Ovis ammon polii x Ovis aries]|nr:hypothetical protein MJT46_012344 [Ovis ammon polii x Ovis aries]